MIDPAKCNTIEEVRLIIDDIDEKLITLLSERQKCVKEIVKFKKTNEEVIAKERQESLYTSRKALASSLGLSPELIETIFKILVEHNIQQELKSIKK